MVKTDDILSFDYEKKEDMDLLRELLKESRVKNFSLRNCWSDETKKNNPLLVYDNGVLAFEKCDFQNIGISADGNSVEKGKVLPPDYQVLRIETEDKKIELPKVSYIDLETKKEQLMQFLICNFLNNITYYLENEKKVKQEINMIDFMYHRLNSFSYIVFQDLKKKNELISKIGIKVNLDIMIEYLKNNSFSIKINSIAQDKS